MFNPSVNLGPSLHFCYKISKYIKYFFLNFEIKYNSACRQPNDQITDSCRAVSSGNSSGTPCPGLTDERATKRLISKKKEMFPAIHNFRDTNCTHIFFMLK